jgi:hypothetical protein
VSELPPFDQLEALASAAHMLYSATLVGNPAPIVQRYYEWMKRIVPGALVIETSTFYRQTPVSRSDTIGIVEKIEDLMVCRHEQADPNLERCEKCTGEEDAEGNGYRWREHFVWLRTQRGRHRWYNASFIRIPRSLDDYREAEGR